MSQNTDNEKSNFYYQDNFEDGVGIRKLRQFLQAMVENFNKEMFSFYDIWGEFPFIYKEKQLNSILAPAIHKYTNNVWLEQPFKKINNEEQRFLDIAVSNGDGKNSNTYLIELKHSWTNYKINEDIKITENTKNKWKKCIEQIGDIKRINIRDEFDLNYQTFKIALMIMPTYINTTEDIDFESAKDYCNNLTKNYSKYTNLFTAVIKINQPKKYQLEYDLEGKEKTQMYPYISFVAKIEKL